MTRPVFIHDRPLLHPFHCIICGLSGPPRLYFIDTGIDLGPEYNLIQEPAVYYCNECWQNRVEETDRLVRAWEEEHDIRFKGSNLVEPTFAWKQQIDLSTVEAQHERTRSERFSTDVAVSDREPELDDQGTEPDDSVPTSTDASGFDDDSDESDDGSAEFNALFS